MDLSRIGQTLSQHRITAPIGAGGMGEVYRAIDTMLGREVAIKVLPANVARDAERLARFMREAHLLASLNHPNIAAIYGLEEADDTLFLALELIEGEDLSERLGRGPCPPVSVAARPRWIAPALAGVALMIALAAAGLLYGAGRSASIPAPPLIRFALDLPEGVAMPEGQPPLISPDGRYIAVVNERELVSDAIWIRESDGSDFRRIPGTAGAREAFWSADSSSLGFAIAGQLRALTVKGGSVRTICTLASEFMIGGAGGRELARATQSLRGYLICGKPRFTPRWLGSGQRAVTTLPRV